MLFAVMILLGMAAPGVPASRDAAVLVDAAHVAGPLARPASGAFEADPQIVQVLPILEADEPPAGGPRGEVGLRPAPVRPRDVRGGRCPVGGVCWSSWLHEAMQRCAVLRC